VKLNRRHLLQTGLAASAFSTALQLNRAKAADVPPVQIAQAGASGYDRATSALLLRCCDLAVAQFLYSQENPAFDGTLSSLPNFPAEFSRYTQVASFRAAQINVLEDTESPVVANKSAEPSTNTDTDTDVAIGIVEVFFGYALTSDTHNIIALRGTQTENEWVNNLSARQANFRNRQPDYGRVHLGFQRSQEKIIRQVQRAIPQLRPNVPLYVTGHSLGGAVAMLTAADLVVNDTYPRNQIQVYTFASPRVGDPTFARFYEGLLPNTFRIVNIADGVPHTPPLNFRGNEYVHAGQEWSFLSQLGDTLINHAIETYQTALQQNVEVNQTRNYPMSAIGCSR
jgi:triacylglycerol lipase